jgi:hypothetical protein
MPRQNRRNYYRILHVQADAPSEVIKASYRTLMQKLRAHPDLGGDAWNAAVINEAYRVLSNAQARREYDRRVLNHHAEINPLRHRNGTRPGPRTRQRQKQVYRSAARRCIFCGSENTGLIPGYADEAQCRDCNSPLVQVSKRRQKLDERRAVKRSSLRDEVPFYTHWPQDAPYRGYVVDLSPLGMQFTTPQELQTNQLIKLEARGLSAVARVVRCSGRGSLYKGNYLVGVQFLTLMANPRQKTK